MQLGPETTLGDLLPLLTTRVSSLSFCSQGALLAGVEGARSLFRGLL